MPGILVRRALSWAAMAARKSDTLMPDKIESAVRAPTPTMTAPSVEVDGFTVEMDNSGSELLDFVKKIG